MASKTYTAFSLDLKRKQETNIAQGALTNSKRPECLVKGVYPTHLVRGQGAHVWDANGKKYIDFICGLGSTILGWAENSVTEAMIGQARKGVSFSLSSPMEVETSEKIKEIFPFIDRMKFLKTGSDACTAAVKIARAYTGRDLVLTQDYHGWHDDFVSLTEPGLGVPKRKWMKKLGAISDINKKVAAVIIEPFNLDISKERIFWLNELQEKCRETGTVLIFDEVITGMRVPKLSVSNYTGIRPDLICFGKAIANGMPLSVVGGKKEIMECGEYFVSSTFAGETVSLAAGLETMSRIQKHYNIDDLWKEGQKFIDSFNKFWPTKIRLNGYPTRCVFEGDPITKAIFWQECVRAGILFGPSFFISFAHMEHLDTTLNTISDIFMRMQYEEIELLGEMPSSPFAQKQREESK